MSSPPQTPPQDYETPVLQGDQGEETPAYQTLEAPPQQGEKLGPQQDGKNNKPESHTYQTLEQSSAGGRGKDHREEIPLGRRNGAPETHVYQALRQQDRERKLYANQSELYGNDSASLYTSVTTTASSISGSGRAHSASMNTSNGTGKQAHPRDYRDVASEKNSRCVQDDNSKRQKLFSVALICCGLLAFVLVMGVAIAALVVALNASSATCDCPEANLLFQQVDQIAALREQITTNQERIEISEQKRNAQEDTLNFLSEAAIQLNSSFTQRIGKLAEEVGSIETTVRDVILTKLGNCTTSVESTCTSITRFLARCTTDRVDYQRTDELVLDFSCSGNFQLAEATVSENTLSCTCSRDIFLVDLDEDIPTCFLSVTRCRY